jgi:hypothetical protein
MLQTTLEDWPGKEKEFIVLVVSFMHGLPAARCKGA